MSNQREYFDTLLDDFKERAKDLKAYKGFEPDRGEIEELRKTMLTPYIVKIMESGIFYKGGLKGKKLTVAGPPDYKVLPISNLDGLIEILSIDIKTFKEIGGTQGQKKIIENEFERLKQDFLKLQERLKFHLGTRAASKAKKMQEQIIFWKGEILKKLVSSHPGLDLATHILNFVPDAPDLTIADRRKLDN